MKKTLLTILLLNSLFLFSQTEKDSLKIDVLNSIKAVNASDYETLLKYFPDFVFENITKEQLLKDMSDGIKSSVSENVRIEIDTIMIIDSVKYARFYFEDGVRTYGIKTKENDNWTFIDLNKLTEKYIPKQITTSLDNN